MSVKDLGFKMPMKKAFNWFDNSSADSTEERFTAMWTFFIDMSFAQLVQSISRAEKKNNPPYIIRQVLTGPLSFQA
jgi:hypothetical protein